MPRRDSAGLVYGYFETKQDLFYTLVDEDAQLLEEAALGGPERQSGASMMLTRIRAREPARSGGSSSNQLRADIWAAATQDEALKSGCGAASADDGLCCAGRSRPASMRAPG